MDFSQVSAQDKNQDGQVDTEEFLEWAAQWHYIVKSWINLPPPLYLYYTGGPQDQVDIGNHSLLAVCISLPHGHEQLVMNVQLCMANDGHVDRMVYASPFEDLKRELTI